LQVTVNTDARTTADTTLNAEFDTLAATFGWTHAEEQLCQDNAARAAFADPGPSTATAAGQPARWHSPDRGQ
jgi:adenosine deaminase